MVYIGIMLLLGVSYYDCVRSGEKALCVERAGQSNQRFTPQNQRIVSTIYCIIMLNICFDLKLSAAHAVSLCVHPGLQGSRPTKPYRLQDPTNALYRLGRRIAA